MKKADTTAGAPVSKLSSRAVLEHWVRAPTTSQRVAQRSRIVLLALDGVGTRDISSILAVSTATVRLWTKRFAENGPEALLPVFLSVLGVAGLGVSGWLGGELVYVQGVAVQPVREPTAPKRRAA